MSTKSKEDAYMRVANARMGYLEGAPTEEYLIALRGQVYGWVEEIQREINKLKGRDEEEE